MARLPAERRLATLVAFLHGLEASAQDDALDVLDILLGDLFARAQQADRKVRLRTLKDLDQAASTLAEACRMLLDSSLCRTVSCASECTRRSDTMSLHKPWLTSAAW